MVFYNLLEFFSFLEVCKNNSASCNHGAFEWAKYGNSMLLHVVGQIARLVEGSVFEDGLLLKKERLANAREVLKTE